MKTLQKLFLLTLVLTISFTTFGQSKTHYITLNVDTATITNQNEDAVSNFGQGSDISNKNFTIKVNVGDVIVWKGLSSVSSKDVVNITSINYKGQKNIFGQNHLGEDRNKPGQVRGTVVTGKKGDVIKYSISFKVLNNGKKRGGTYHIDPKIQVQG